MKIILLLSGGLDSATLAYQLKKGTYLECMFIDYGQRHIKEYESAKKICSNLKVKLHRVELPNIFEDCALVGSKTIPEGASEVVPNRNMLMISTATAYCIQHDFDGVAFGANADDAVYGFYDCSQHFIRAMREAMRFCHSKSIELLTPFIRNNMTKKDVVRRAVELSVPISETWSCYKGEKEPCGKCGACKLRNEAMLEVDEFNGKESNND